MKYFDKPCSPQFREVLIDEHPLLGKREDYARLSGAVLFPSMVDDESKNPVLSATYLSAIENVDYSQSYSARRFLNDFSHEVFRIEVSNWNYTTGKARELTGVNCSERLQDAVEQETARPRSEKNVLLATGEKITRKKRDEIRESVLECAMNRLDSAIPEAQEVARYMNALNSNHFARLMDYLPDAEAVAKTLPTLGKIAGGGTKYNLNCLATISQLISQPFYGPSEAGKTTRLFPLCTSIAGLSSPVRRALCKGLIECDLEHAHFAFNAAIWENKLIRTYLDTGVNVWEDLVKHVAGPVSGVMFEVVKGYLKKALYALFYGARIEKLSKNLSLNLGRYGIDVAGPKFMKHYLVSEICRARKIAYTKVEAAGGAQDIYGRWIAVAQDTPARSVLSQVAQSLELYCMSSVIDVAKARGDFDVLLWQHDGATIKLNRPSSFAAVSKDINSAVRDRSASANIALRVSYLHL